MIPSGLAELLDDRLAHAGEDVMNALKLLSLCEPLDIDAFAELAGEEAVDSAEMRGLIRIVTDAGGTLTARFAHPLFAEVVRRRVGTASARKLRGRIAKILRDRDLSTAASRIRLAQLCIESDRGADVDLLITAAKDAVFLSNLPLGEQLHGPRSTTAAACPRPPCCRARCCGRDIPRRPTTSSRGSHPTTWTRWNSCSGASRACRSCSGPWATCRWPTRCSVS